MLPINFEGAREIGKPKGMTDEECSGLPILQGFSNKAAGTVEFVQIGVLEGSDYPFTLSAYMPSKEDLEALNAGRPLWVRDLTHVVFPRSLFTTDENGEIN